MLSGLPSRRGTMRSIKSAFGLGEEFSNISQFEEAPTVTAGLNTVYLPPSIPSLKFMSPALWNWITTGEKGQKLDTPRVFSPAGESLNEPLPKCLTVNLPPLPTKERPLSFSPTNAKPPMKQARYYMLIRKPVVMNDISEAPQVKYCFVNGICS